MNWVVKEGCDYFSFFTPGEGGVVLDVGATKGDFAIDVAKYRPSRCVSVEAAPTNYQPLVECLNSLNEAAERTVHEVVLGALTSNVSGKFVPLNEKGPWSETCPTTREDLADDNVVGSAKSVSLEQLLKVMRLVQIDFLKMDIEGGEFAILLNPTCMSEIARRTSKIAIEFHLHFLRDVMGKSAQEAADALGEIITQLERSGFEVLLSKGRDYMGHPHQDVGIRSDTCCIDMWARKNNA